MLTRQKKNSAWCKNYSLTDNSVNKKVQNPSLDLVVKCGEHFYDPKLGRKNIKSWQPC